MKTSPTMVPVLLLLIAFGCFLAAPAVLAEGPWDGENSSGGSHPLHGSTTTVHDGEENPDGNGILVRGAENRNDTGDWLFDMFFRITIRFIVDYVVVPQSMNQMSNAGTERPTTSATAVVDMSHRAAK